MCGPGDAVRAAPRSPLSQNTDSTPTTPPLPPQKKQTVNKRAQELATAYVEQLEAKVMILNNQHLGMVVQWEDRFYKANRAHTCVLGAWVGGLWGGRWGALGGGGGRGGAGR